MPYADQENVISCAKQLLHGDFEEFSKAYSYFGIYPFQIGIIYYIALIFKIFNTEKFFDIANIQCCIFINKFIFNEKNYSTII